MIVNNKDFNKLKAKTLALQVADIDAKTRKVVGYFSAFNIKDADNDVILKGAFKESIEQRGPQSSGNRKIAHLWNHNWDEPIAKIIELYEDDYGLKFVSQLGRSQKAQDTFLNYQDEIIREHSIGFIYLEEGTRFIQTNNDFYTEISNLELYEGSSVTFGSNSFTNVLEVNKSLQLKDVLSDLENEQKSLISVLQNGFGSDERFYEIELRLKTLQSKYEELILNKNININNNIENIKINTVEKQDKNENNYLKFLQTLLKNKK